MNTFTFKFKTFTVLSSLKAADIILMSSCYVCVHFVENDCATKLQFAESLVCANRYCINFSLLVVTSVINLVLSSNI